MENYITHKRFRGMGACGKQLNIPYGTECHTLGDFIMTPDNRHICAKTSETAQRYFSCNDDRRGLERGALTYAIAFAARDAGNGYRFSDEEQQILRRKWGKFLMNFSDVILFNDAFFAAAPNELEQLAKDVHITIKRR